MGKQILLVEKLKLKEICVKGNIEWCVEQNRKKIRKRQNSLRYITV